MLLVVINLCLVRTHVLSDESYECLRVSELGRVMLHSLSSPLEAAGGDAAGSQEGRESCLGPCGVAVGSSKHRHLERSRAPINIQLNWTLPHDYWKIIR